MKFLIGICLFLSACGNKHSKHSNSISDTTKILSADTLVQTISDSINQPINPAQIIGTSYKMTSFEVAQNDIPSIQIWEQAKGIVDSLGTGWRLPTVAELQLIHAKKDSIGGFHGDVYWSSEESSPMNARTINFYNGRNGSFSKIYSARIRAVRSL